MSSQKTYFTGDRLHGSVEPAVLVERMDEVLRLYPKACSGAVAKEAVALGGSRADQKPLRLVRSRPQKHGDLPRRLLSHLTKAAEAP